MIGREAIEALAESWASIDGKQDAYRRERDEKIPLSDPTCTGHYEGYLAEAGEMIVRLRARGFDVVRIASAVTADTRVLEDA